MYMGKCVSRRMLTAVRRLWGQVSTPPMLVLDQSNERIRSPIAPPPTRKCSPGAMDERVAEDMVARG
jgi:hypothetical protein